MVFRVRVSELANVVSCKPALSHISLSMILGDKLERWVTASSMSIERVVIVLAGDRGHGPNSDYTAVD